MSGLTQYRLHVPLETTPGMLLESPSGKRIIILARPAQLLDREPYISFVSSNAMVIKQWILFDPMSEPESRNVLDELRARIPSLSMNMGANFRIPASELYISKSATYNGSISTLIPASMTPIPTWIDAMGSCSWKGQDVLGATLTNSPLVTNERLLIALDLFIASQYDHLPQSQFLAKLTILDTLAARAKRDDTAIAWIDKRIAEADAFDSGLANALGNLKSQSHTNAIKALVKRAVLSQGGSEVDANRLEKDAGRLYSARSNMSHAGYTAEIDLGGATQLARLVLNAAINNPSILDIT